MALARTALASRSDLAFLQAFLQTRSGSVSLLLQRGLRMAAA
jgi:hypothetical protein